MLLEKVLSQPEVWQAVHKIVPPRVPAHENLLRGLPSYLDLAIARTEKVAWSWRNISKRSPGIFSLARCIDKVDADRLLRLALADAQEGGGQ